MVLGCGQATLGRQNSSPSSPPDGEYRSNILKGGLIASGELIQLNEPLRRIINACHCARLLPSHTDVGCEQRPIFVGMKQWVPMVPQQG